MKDVAPEQSEPERKKKIVLRRLHWRHLHGISGVARPCVGSTAPSDTPFLSAPPMSVALEPGCDGPVREWVLPEAGAGLDPATEAARAKRLEEKGVRPGRR